MIETSRYLSLALLPTRSSSAKPPRSCIFLNLLSHLKYGVWKRVSVSHFSIEWGGTQH
jgi:hypothetical protein